MMSTPCRAVPVREYVRARELLWDRERKRVSRAGKRRKKSNKGLARKGGRERKREGGKVTRARTVFKLFSIA